MTPEELQAFVDALPVPALILAHGQIRAANQRAAALAGVSVVEFVASPEPFLRYVSPEDQPALLQRDAARQRGEHVPDEVDFTGLSADGRPVPSRAHVAPFPAAGDRASLILLSDERLRAANAEIIHGLVDAAVATQRERSETEIFRVLSERLTGLGLTTAVLELRGDRFRFAPFLPARSELGQQMRKILPDWSPLPHSVDLRSADGVLVEDLPALLGEVAGLARATFARRSQPRALVTTIRVNGEPAFALASAGAGVDRSVAGAFGLLGQQVGAALETARHMEELDRRNSELSLLLELGHEVVGALDLPQILQAAARTAAQSLRCACAYVMLPDESGSALRIAAREDPEGPEEAQVGSTFSLALPSLSALAFATQKPYVSSDNSADHRVDPELARRFRCLATLAVPLLSQGRALGVLSLFERSGRVFDAQDMRLAAHAAQLIAAAVENARLYSEQRARAEEMALLNDVARRLAGSLELRPLLELGGETLQRLLDGDRWFTLLPTADGSGLRFDALPPEYADLSATVLRFDEPSTAALAYKERRVVQALDPLAAPGTASRELALRFGNRATLAVPLMARNECLGVAVVLGGNRTGSFSQAEMDRALAVAGQLGLALLSARLYQDLRQSYAELERAQKELVDRERLAALGELSAVIAHEVRNPLGVIFNSVGSLRRLIDAQGDVKLLLDIVGEEADRLNRMVGDLLDYSRPLQPALQGVPLRPLIEEALTAARQQIGPAAEQVKLHVRVATEVATVPADARLLRQALINLFLNAYQAMPRGGHLEVHARSGEMEGQPCAELIVTDTGAGIPAELGARVFLPFFTTKPTGTGLGLAVVKRIVEGHRGSITVGQPAVGAEFHMRLPLEG